MDTQNVEDGTIIPYTITGVDELDIEESLTGHFTINDNTSFITLNIAEDLHTEGDELLTLTLDNGRSSYNLLIRDTSQSLVLSYASTLDNFSLSGVITTGSSITYASTLNNFSIAGLGPPMPTTQLYASTLDNSTIAPEDIVKKYAFTLDNSTIAPEDIVKKYAFTLDNSTLAPPVAVKYAFTLDNSTLVPDIVKKYAFTLDNSTIAPDIVEKYASTLDNSTIAP